MKKIMLLLLVVSFYQTVEAQLRVQTAQTEAEAANEAAATTATTTYGLPTYKPNPSLTSDEKKAAAEAMIQTGKHEELDGAHGSDQMVKCVELSGNNMRYLYGSEKKSTFHWQTMIDGHPDCLDKTADTKKCDALKKKAAICDGVAFLLHKFEKDWNDKESYKTDTVKGGNPEIKCQGNGIATLDYEGCVKFVNNGDIMDVAQSAIQQGQQLVYQDKAMTAQMEASSSPESATAGLKALHTGVKGQEEIATQRAVLDSGKLAALSSYYSQIPTMGDLEDACSSYKAMAPNELKEADGCNGAVSMQHEFALLKNGQAREKMKSKLAKVGIDVASDAVMAALMSKRAGDINNAIAKINTFKPIDPLAPAENNLQTTYCQQNPGDAKCLTGGLEQTFDAMGENVITFGEGGTGTSYANNNPNLDTSTGLNNAVGPDGKTPVASIGSVISAASQKGGLENIVGAATVSKGSASGAGGGGGGGSGGGGSGGGGAPPAGQQAGGNTMGIPGKAPTYGGGGGTLSMMGGLGLNKSKAVAKDDANPFGKLFNKDANKSGAVDFGRSPSSQKVGNKTDNLFEMISKRYTNVNTDKRLIEYEMTK
jgi:hypothetical protein